jgi:2-dehydro-3-deoxyglucarate aldolase/4-hydroxy-2-oxoheptanedioate aldolase
MARSLRELVGHRGPKLGHAVFEFATPGIGHILAAAGAEFMFLDMEHSGFGYETVKSVVRYAQAAGLPAFVRVPGRDYQLMARAADIGAEGIMVPMISSAEEAAECARHIRYTPRGHRGVGLALAHDDYREGPVLPKLEALNNRMVFMPLIETAAGVENVDAIAAVDEVDVLWMGHFDLSCSMGIPGQFDQPHFGAAIDRVVAAAKRSGKGVGRLVTSVEEGLREAARGFDWLCYGGDVWLLQGSLRQGIGGIRAGLREGR